MAIAPFQHTPSGSVTFGAGTALRAGTQGPLKKAAKILVVTDAGVELSLIHISVDLAADALPGGFDVVTCCEVIEHLDDQPGAMRKLADACAPGGRVLITCPTGPMYPTEKHFGHVRHPTREDLIRWAADVGLVPSVVVSWGFPFYALTKCATNLNPELALERFGMEKDYGVAERAVSAALYVANFANVPSSSRGVQPVSYTHLSCGRAVVAARAARWLRATTTATDRPAQPR